MASALTTPGDEYAQYGISIAYTEPEQLTAAIVAFDQIGCDELIFMGNDPDPAQVDLRADVISLWCGDHEPSPVRRGENPPQDVCPACRAPSIVNMGATGPAVAPMPATYDASIARNAGAWRTPPALLVRPRRKARHAGATDPGLPRSLRRGFRGEGQEPTFQ
ncbi:hypothetical protein [Nonomuraea sp. NPDC049625]|uniref:hypothetical protein n=1 Tax=Nonomuraea sp. NPDC049625 TaxID=3155775 RepID=UPI00342B61F0